MSAARQLPPHLWKPGTSGNPGGRSPLPADLRAIRALTREECARFVAKWARKSCADIAALTDAERAALPMVEAAIVSIFQSAITKGDFMRLSFLLDRAIGKVQTVEVSPEDLDTQLASMNDAELIAHVEAIIKKRKGEAA